MTARPGDWFEGVVVVPEHAVAAAARSATRVETLASLRARLRASLAPDLELAAPIAVRLALARVAPEVVSGDPWLGPIARRGGRAWLRVLVALDDAMTALTDQADALDLVARGRGHDSTVLRARLLARLLWAKDQALADAGLLDPRGEAERVADLVAHADPVDVSAALSAVLVRARGIVEWRPSDLALWRVLDASLSRVSGRATIELPVFDRPLDAGREQDPLDRLIEAVASALDDAPMTTPIAAALGDMGPSAPGVAPSRATARVEVRQAMSADAQARAVADAVYAALMEGASPSEVLVALASEDDTSAREILRALADADIPAVDARRTRPHGSNLTAFADRALEVAERGSSRGDVAQLLRSPYVDPQALLGTDLDSGRRMLRDISRALAETPTARGDTAAEQLAATVATSALAQKRGNPLLAQAALRLGQSVARVADGRTRTDHARSSRALWRELGVGRSPAPSPVLGQNTPATRVDLADLAARARDEEAWQTLTAALASYERAVLRLGLADAPASLSTFRDELAYAHASQVRGGLSLENPACGAVRVISLADLPEQAAALVVVADADDASWPDGRPRAELIIPGLEERLFEARDPAVRPLAQVGPAAVLARVALGTSGARQVVFTYVARDEEGGTRSPAPVAAPFGRPGAAVWRGTAAPMRPLSERDWLLGTLAHRPDTAGALAPDAERRARLDRRREGAFGAELSEGHPLTATLPRGEPFTAILTEETGGAARAIAASSVDGLASCVFRAFVIDVLRPRRTREAHDIADTRELGQIVHLGLEAAFRATAALWSVRPRDAEEILRAGLAAADRALGRDDAASDLARVAIDQARAGVRAVLDWSLADEVWDFAYAEQAFGDEGAWEPLVLEHGGVRVALRGRIDRVDVAHDSGAVRVIDYKTRERSAESHMASLGATKFQIALYARAAEAALGKADKDGLYLAVQRLRPGGGPKNRAERWAEAHDLVEGVPRFEREILERIGALRRGELAVRPRDAGSCLHCDYDAVCRKPRFAPAAPIEDDLPDEGR